MTFITPTLRQIFVQTVLGMEQELFSLISRKPWRRDTLISHPYETAEFLYRAFIINPTEHSGKKKILAFKYVWVKGLRYAF